MQNILFSLQVLSGLCMFHFFCCMCDGPGYLPRGWRPRSGRRTWSGQLQWCSSCKGYKAPRSHHCPTCQHCVLKMSHHCPWINNCVGYFNQGNYVVFLASSLAASFLAIITLAYSALTLVTHNRESHWTFLTALFVLGLCVGVVTSLSILLVRQVRGIVMNMTQIEDWVRKKAEVRYRGQGEGGSLSLIIPPVP